jgi:DeoR/GlpR family transcriptional regulator of sugar metabolism
VSSQPFLGSFLGNVMGNFLVKLKDNSGLHDKELYVLDLVRRALSESASAWAADSAGYDKRALKHFARLDQLTQEITDILCGEHQYEDVCKGYIKCKRCGDKQWKEQREQKE